MPRPSSTCWQKLCVVAMVAPSNSDAARTRRCRRSAICSGVPADRCRTSSSVLGPPMSRAVWLIRSRTRSRSSWVAARLNVASMSSDSSTTPSAT